MKHSTPTNGKTPAAMPQPKNLEAARSRLSTELARRLESAGTGSLTEIHAWLQVKLDEIFGPAMPEFSKKMIPSPTQLSPDNIFDVDVTGVTDPAAHRLSIYRSRLHMLINQRVNEYTERDGRAVSATSDETMRRLSVDFDASKDRSAESRRKAAATMAAKEPWMAGVADD